MDNATVLALFDQRMRRDAAPDGPGVVVERDGGVVRQSGPASAWNGVLWSDLDEDTADEAIKAQVARFTAAGTEFEWKLYSHDRPADLGERLLAAGFTPEPAEALMVAAVADLPTDVPPPEGVTLLPVTDEAGVDLMTDVHREVFGPSRTLDWLRERLLTQLSEAPETVEAVVAMAGDRPVCSARMDFHPGTGFASLWGGGTLEEWRGRGIYRALVAYRTRIAAARGYEYLQVDASDDSRPILQRLGFARLSTTTPYVYRP